MGTPKFAADILEGLVRSDFNIVAAVCQPDKEYGRKRELRPCEVKQACLDLGIPALSPAKVREDYEGILEQRPDLIITCAYGQIIPKALLEYPRYGCINTHGSLLPAYRGASPVQTAILNGEEVTGITIMEMNEKMDEGDILYQEEIAIDIHDTSTILFDKLSRLALEMLISYLPKVFADDTRPRKQDDSLATYTRKLGKEIEHISFDDETLNVYNHIRSLLDDPGCHFILNGRKYKICRAFYELANDCQSGCFKGLQEDHLRIDCNDGYIKIYELIPEGKKRMDARSFHNGAGRNLAGNYVE